MNYAKAPDFKPKHAEISFAGKISTQIDLIVYKEFLKRSLIIQESYG